MKNKLDFVDMLKRRVLMGFAFFFNERKNRGPPREVY